MKKHSAPGRVIGQATTGLDQTSLNIKLDELMKWALRCFLFALVAACLVTVAGCKNLREPTESEIATTFHSGPKPYLPAWAGPGFDKIRKHGCSDVEGLDGKYVCDVSYTLQNLRGKPPEASRKTFVFYKVADQWARQPYNDKTRATLQEIRTNMPEHQLERLGVYCALSLLLSMLLNKILPSVDWNRSALHERATPYAGQPIRSGSDRADDVGDRITQGMNSLTPAAVLAILGMALGTAGFLIGGWMLPATFISLDYAGWPERSLLLVAAMSWCVIGARMTQLSVNFLAMGFVLVLTYVVLVLPVMWIVYGSDLGKVQGQQLAFLARQASPPFQFVEGQWAKVNQNGYRQVFGN